MRKSVASWVFAFAAVLAVTFAAACMSGDDDDDDEYKCDWGQPITSWGDLMSPIQDCFRLSDGGNEALDYCEETYADEEVEWTCHCIPRKCEQAKERREQREQEPH